MGKRSAPALVLVLVLVLLNLVSASASPVFAHPAHAPSVSMSHAYAALARSGFVVRNVGNVMHLTLPHQINCSGIQQEWVQFSSNRVSEPDYVLQATILILVHVDQYNNFRYCGYYESGGYQVHLLQNCHNFYSWVYDTWTGLANSNAKIFHCTPGYYTFYGPTTQGDCPFISNNPQQLQANQDSDGPGLAEYSIDCNDYE
jgi:hypothetical protein